MRRTTLLAAFAAVLLMPAIVGGTAQATPLRAQCSASSVAGVIGGASKCLRAGEFCAAAHEADYERYGFACEAGHLRTRGSAQPARPAQVEAGATVLLGARTRTGGCRRGALPDRRCSPGAYARGLTKAVICSPTFRTGDVRDVPQSEKFAVEQEYGMAPRPYGRTIEIDHIVPLELGGSNDIANLFPEPGAVRDGYHVKDRLENRLHVLVCGGQMSLAAAQAGIARDWLALYRRVL
jgi:hypothetical protein